MSWRAIDVAYRTSDGLSATETAVYYAYAYHTNRDGKAWPSIATLCRDTNLSIWTIRRAIFQLETKGRIKVHRKRGTALSVHLTALSLHLDRALSAHKNLNRTVKNLATTRAARSGDVAENQSSAARPWLDPTAIAECPYCNEQGLRERTDGWVRCSHRVVMPDGLTVGDVLGICRHD
jgi:DNA-binding transcriptional regulator YhcF (GntR family)